MQMLVCRTKLEDTMAQADVCAFPWDPHEHSHGGFRIKQVVLGTPTPQANSARKMNIHEISPNGRQQLIKLRAKQIVVLLSWSLH